MWLRQKRFVSFKLCVFALLYAFLITSQLTTSIWAAPLTTKSTDSAARTIYYQNQPPNALGRYQYEFQTTNGITTKGAGNEYGSVGAIQYVSLEGIPVTWTFVADANGYHPEGDHLPRTPFHVWQALEYIRTHPTVDEKKSRQF